MILEAYQERELNARAKLKQSVTMTKALGKLTDTLMQIPETNETTQMLNNGLYE